MVPTIRVELEHGIPSHKTLGRLFGLISPQEFELIFRHWVGSVLSALGPDAVVAIDGKTSRRSGKVDGRVLHLVRCLCESNNSFAEILALRQIGK